MLCLVQWAVTNGVLEKFVTLFILDYDIFQDEIKCK